MIVVSIDPSSNAIGLSVFDPETKELFIFDQIVAPKLKCMHKRIVYLHDQVSEKLMSLDPKETTYAYVESTVMAGRSGEVLAKATGALIAAIPYWAEYSSVQNSTVKKLVAGNGKAEKIEVARGVLIWAQGNLETIEKVRSAIQAGHFDALDSLAIGVAGYQRECGNG